MLETLEAIPWSELQHAYGYASDAPDLIRSLLSSRAEDRAQGRGRLCETIIHQGSCYQATPYAAPFLFELLQNSTVEDRHLLIYLLVTLALGCESEYLPYEFSLAQYRGQREARVAMLSKEERENSAMGPHIDLECYESVNARTGAFVSLLSDDSEDVRIAAAYALCWFPECESALPLIKERVQFASSGERELGNVALAYGLLCYHSDVPVEAELLNPLLQQGGLFLRAAAAIALAKTMAGTKVLDVLDEGAQSDDLQDIYETTHFNDGRLREYAAGALEEALNGWVRWCRGPATA